MSSHFKNNSGFSIIELIISISIVSTIMAVVVSNQTKYTDGLALSTLADEISLTISQAQAYGAGVRETAPGSLKFDAAYGLSFTTSSNKTYIYFADQDGDKIYDVGESLSQIEISRGNYISNICAVLPGNVSECGIGQVDISFTRPKTEPIFAFSASWPTAIGAKIILMSPAGDDRSVTVYSSGQITVQ